jgi:hypothetical protein
MIKRRVLVQRWPAVPTAPNTAPIKDMSRSALSLMMMALLPPSSSKDRPKRSPTAAPTALPMRVLPVALTKGMRVSWLIHSPTSRPPLMITLTPSGTPLRLNTRSVMCWQAMLHRGVFSLGFQRHTSPQIHASAVFQLHTATGKLKAVMMPTSP